MKFGMVLLFAATPLIAGTRVWTGAGTDAKWSNPANWDGGTPLQGDDLVFPSLKTGSTNDFPSGLRVHSISYFVNGSGFSGNPIFLGAGGFTLSDRFIVSIIIVHISAPIALVASQTWTFGAGSEATTFDAVDLGGNTLTLDVNSISVHLPSIAGNGTIVKRGAAGAFFESAPGASLNVAEGTASFFKATTADLDVAAGATLSVQSEDSTSRNVRFEPGSHYQIFSGSWLNATAAVSVNNATLDVVGSLLSSPSFVINNRGTDRIAGTFLGLPEGAIIYAAPGFYRISYIGGDGNDITLTRLAVPATATTTTATAAISRQTVTLTASVTAGATGNLGFYEKGVLFGTAPLDAAGHAGLTTQLAPGAHEITVAYSGAEGFATSRATITVNVARSRAARH